MSTARQIAVLGTGLMGQPMAVNLARAGFVLRLWNRSTDKARAVCDQAGADCQIADSPAAAVAGAGAVVVMLSSGPVCEEVLFGDGGAAQAMDAGALLIVMSSIAMAEAKDFAARAHALGLRWIDAPVSGGTVAAQAGTLSIMAGGEDADIDAARPILNAMGKLTHVGPAGSGALTKLINQLLVASTIAAVSEAVLLARQGGANPARVREALLGGFASSRILELHGQRMIERNFTPGGPAKYQLKDTRAALAVVQGLGLDLPVLALADALFADLIAHGGADLDHAALILELERRNSLSAPDALTP